ncbi:MAG: pyridoxamine 5'-phosphate oxidase family protein [Chloroflexi bacterium]|nr:pyridoxamine 5'-phosphate oxidase family protein [Chloroflexota bacterium]
MLAAGHADAWVATASPEGAAHMVPLSSAWDGTLMTLVTASTTQTARNLAAMGRARLALGGTRDVVMVDARLVEAVSLAEVPDEVAAAYAVQTDWDPRQAGGDFVYLLLRPERIQAWRGVEENRQGRTIMREGRWLD